MATAEAITYSGARPVLSMWTSTPIRWTRPRSKPPSRRKRRRSSGASLRSAGGHGSDLKFARERDLVVIEDAAQAHGAKYKGRAAGTMGDAAVSALSGKNLAHLASRRDRDKQP